jgi:hypothetical protein
VRRVGHVEHVDRREVVPLVGDRLAVRRPPVTASSIHLFLRDELGDAVLDLRRRPGGEAPRSPAGERRHPQVAIDDVGDPIARRRQSGVVRETLAGLDLLRRAALARDGEELV